MWRKKRWYFSVTKEISVTVPHETASKCTSRFPVQYLTKYTLAPSCPLSFYSLLSQHANYKYACQERDKENVPLIIKVQSVETQRLYKILESR